MSDVQPAYAGRDHANRPHRWPDERTAKLRELVAAGLTSRKIAKALGGISRNGVIGKCRRLGLSLKGEQSNQWTAAEKPAKPKRPPATRLKPGPRPAGLEQKQAAGALLPPWHVVAAEAWKRLPWSKPVELVNLSPDGCRWPIGEHSPYLFCNRFVVNGRPYCCTHNQMSGG